MHCFPVLFSFGIALAVINNETDSLYNPEAEMSSPFMMETWMDFRLVSEPFGVHILCCVGMT